MPRSGVEARHRLQQAALELYSERGYDQTTTSEIAERAGVTERTFFRHFVDKREVIFDGQIVLQTALVRAMPAAGDVGQPLAVLYDAFCSVIPMLEHNRPLSVRRSAVISATPALRERELTKEASLSNALAAALEDKGVAPRRAFLAAHIGMAAFAHATVAWLQDPHLGLRDSLDKSFQDVRALTRR